MCVCALKTLQNFANALKRKLSFSPQYGIHRKQASCHLNGDAEHK